MVKMRVSPNTFLRLFIQFPGRGRNETKLGKNQVKIKGKARPRPMAMKMRKIEKLLEVKAKVRAVPKKGALQGVERIVARIPLKKSPTNPSSV